MHFLKFFLAFLQNFRRVSGFAGWQAPFMAQQPPAGQLAHPQPQDDFPFLLSRTILVMTAVTARSKTAPMTIVAIFPIIHVSIEILLSLLCCFQFHVCGQLCRLFIRSEQHINHTAKDDDGSQKTDYI